MVPTGLLSEEEKNPVDFGPRLRAHGSKACDADSPSIASESVPSGAKVKTTGLDFGTGGKSLSLARPGLNFGTGLT